MQECEEVVEVMRIDLHQMAIIELEHNSSSTRNLKYFILYIIIEFHQRML